MNEKLVRLREEAVEAYRQSLIEEHDAVVLLRKGDVIGWKAQQHLSMQADHTATNAKQAYEVELYNVYGSELLA